MKFKSFFLVAALMTAFVGFTACSKDDKDGNGGNHEQGEYTESTTYAVTLNGNAVAAGATVEATGDRRNVADLVIVNKTSEEVETYFTVEFVEGPAAMRTFGACYGAHCFSDLQNIYSSPAIPMAGNGSQDIAIEYMGDATGTATYRLTVGKGEDLENPDPSDLEDPQVIFVKLTM